jgi:phage tail-like protein
MADRLTYTGGLFTFEFDDRTPAGYVNSIDGGHFKADAISYSQGADFLTTKYAGRAKYDDITISVGAAMSPKFWEWVEKSLDGKPERRNGAVVAYDFYFKERARRTFYSALIAEIGFPALDAASKASAALTVKITPEHISYKKGDEHTLRDEQAKDQTQKQKMWKTSNFRFSLDKFSASEACIKIEAFTVKQNIIDNPVGNEKYARKEVGRLELPQIVVTFPEADLDDWMTWWNESVGEGNRKDKTTTGVITYYANDQKSELMHIELSGVSLVAVEVEKYEAHKEGIATAKATLAIEGLVLKPAKGTV